MKPTRPVVIALSGIAALMAVAVPRAAAAPADSRSVQDTVESLESNGYKVILNKVGAAPLQQCRVSAIRPGRDVTEFRQNRRDQTVERILYETVYVDVAC